MVKLTINNKQITVADNSTILQAAQKLDIAIPTLCHLEGYPYYTSCMICVVEDMQTGNLLPACSARVTAGMEIETENDKIREARKDTLDLLLSEHVGNCEAPCLKSCPAYMNIPRMIRQIKEQKFREALETVKEQIALPAVLGRICPAPCERGCNRKYLDDTLSICLLKRFVADVDLSGKTPYLPQCQQETGKKIGIIGAGPAGLAAAYYLHLEGHSCIVYDDHAEAGGMLRYGIPDDKLDKTVLDREIDTINKLGVQFQMQKRLGNDFSLKEIRRENDAVILTTGTVTGNPPYYQDLQKMPHGIAANRKTFETNITGVFAGGNVLGEGRMAIRSCAHGRFIAYAVHQLVSGKPVTGFPRRFNSVMGHLQAGEGEQFVQLASRTGQVRPKKGADAGYTPSEAVEEAERCFRCDCRKPVSCKLREYADKYGAEQRRFMTDTRNKFELIIQHDMVLYEPGKCIKCGLCVQITQKAGEELGLTFVNRGFDIRIAVPLNKSIREGLQKVARQCVEACPTAALALIHAPEEKEKL